ncbi:cation transporter [Thermococcus guaymasensis DSM 11113]|uniref:Cation transporter n=1 Tax=Thermococcus guaymasensis DSM 11113 TaxID=1432656 RepID=A0A0X1KKW7_9EURY|nr:sodium:calcium antiporter [Thermococcus guaymasensis]AJC71887.1 cation transporter [Thermococcus guaymasensis DSM 11113]
MLEFIIWTLSILIGIAILVVAGDKLSDKIIEVARKAGISPLVISIVLVSFSTTLPEITTSALASYQGVNGIALGNALGSIFANIALILGLAAMIKPLKAGKSAYENSLVMLASLVFLILLSLDGTLSRLDGLLLLAYAVYLRWLMKKHARNDVEWEPTGGAKPTDYVLLFVLGLLLVSGAQMVVFGGKNIAQALGISDFVIGATVVAIGTSLPEMTNALYGAIRERGSISVGNIIGANIMNALVVLGIASLIRPLRTGASVLTILLVLFAMLPMIVSLKKTGGINRPLGAYFLVLYIVYLALMFAGFEL